MLERLHRDGYAWFRRHLDPQPFAEQLKGHPGAAGERLPLESSLGEDLLTTDLGSFLNTALGGPSSTKGQTPAGASPGTATSWFLSESIDPAALSPRPPSKTACLT